VEIERSSEADSNWEDYDPIYRVYLFEGGDRFIEQSPDPTSWAVETFDVRDAEVVDVIRWAQEAAGADRLFAVALVGENQKGQRGLTWLVGVDANDDPPWDESVGRRQSRMKARRGRPLVLGE